MQVTPAGEATPVIPATPALPVVIGSTGSTITANLTGSAAKTYATVNMALEPQFGTTFTDLTSAPASTTQMLFGTVPDGIYLVPINGLDVKGVATELKSGLVTVGKLGQLTASDWQVVLGSASISGQTVDITKAGEVRVLDTGRASSRRTPRSPPRRPCTPARATASGCGPRTRPTTPTAGTP